MASEATPGTQVCDTEARDKALQYLADIPTNLRGFSWLTMAQLSVVSRVSEAMLATTVANWGKNGGSSGSTALLIESVNVQTERGGPRIKFFRPFTTETALSSNQMQGQKQRDENRAQSVLRGCAVSCCGCSGCFFCTCCYFRIASMHLLIAFNSRRSTFNNYFKKPTNRCIAVDCDLMEGRSVG